MLKKILELEGAQELSKATQKLIQGKGDDLLACRCPDGSLVIGHADTCNQLINLFCAQDS